jgi:hypothetical protein
MSESRDPDDGARLALYRAIAERDPLAVTRALDASPRLATTAIRIAASRDDAETYFLDVIKHYVYAGDTALHIAAAVVPTCDRGVARRERSAGPGPQPARGRARSLRPERLDPRPARVTGLGGTAAPPHAPPATPIRLPSGSVKCPMTRSVPGFFSGPSTRVPPSRSAACSAASTLGTPT